MCTKQRPHAELIKAWADGAIIQYEFPSGVWNDVAGNSPSWGMSSVYRIKPEPTDIERYSVEVGDVWLTYSRMQTIRCVNDAGKGSVEYVNDAGYSTLQKGAVLVFRRGVVNKFGG